MDDAPPHRIRLRALYPSQRADHVRCCPTGSCDVRGVMRSATLRSPPSWCLPQAGPSMPPGTRLALTSFVRLPHYSTQSQAPCGRAAPAPARNSVRLRLNLLPHMPYGVHSFAGLVVRHQRGGRCHAIRCNIVLCSCGLHSLCLSASITYNQETSPNRLQTATNQTNQSRLKL